MENSATVLSQHGFFLQKCNQTFLLRASLQKRTIESNDSITTENCLSQKITGQWANVRYLISPRDCPREWGMGGASTRVESR
jgi:uncharacterized protein YaaQ